MYIRKRLSFCLGRHILQAQFWRWQIPRVRNHTLCEPCHMAVGDYERHDHLVFQFLNYSSTNTNDLRAFLTSNPPHSVAKFLLSGMPALQDGLPDVGLSSALGSKG